MLRMIRALRSRLERNASPALPKMPDHRPQAIANEFLRRRASPAWPPQMLIQKLAYIAHGWNLAVNNLPLTDAAPEAWDNGPVYRDIWDHVRDFGYQGPECTLINPWTQQPFRANLSQQETDVIDHVWKKYGDKSAQALSRMTHEPGTPWFTAYFRARNTPLDNAEIRQHYINLAMAGREQRAEISN